MTCSACRVELTKLVTLGSPNDPEIASTIGNIARDSKGRYYLSTIDKAKVVIFGADGKFLSAFGSAGEGPGEFGRANSPFSGIDGISVGAADTVFVFHSLNKLEVYSPTWKFVRHVDLPRVDNGIFRAITSNGTVVMSARVRSQSQVGHPFHIYNSTGAALRSMGADGRAVGPGAPAPEMRAIAVGSDPRSFWAQRDYQLQHWSIDGRLLHDFKIEDVFWWPPPPAIQLEQKISQRPGQPFVTKPADINLAGIDSAGVVWINGRIRAKPGTLRLEAIDPATGSLILSQVHEERFQRLINGTNYSYSTRENASGEVSIDIYRLRLIRP